MLVEIQKTRHEVWVVESKAVYEYTTKNVTLGYLPNFEHGCIISSLNQLSRLQTAALQDT